MGNPGAGGHTIVAVVKHKVIEALAVATRQTESILLTTISTIWDASAPVVLITSPALAADLDDVKVGIQGTVAYDFHLLVVLKNTALRSRLGADLRLNFLATLTALPGNISTD